MLKKQNEIHIAVAAQRDRFKKMMELTDVRIFADNN